MKIHPSTIILICLVGYILFRGITGPELITEKECHASYYEAFKLMKIRDRNDPSNIYDKLIITSGLLSGNINEKEDLTRLD